MQWLITRDNAAKFRQKLRYLTSMSMGNFVQGVLLLESLIYAIKTSRPATPTPLAEQTS